MILFTSPFYPKSHIFCLARRQNHFFAQLYFDLFPSYDNTPEYFGVPCNVTEGVGERGQKKISYDCNV